MQVYSDRIRATLPYALPDVEVFYRTATACRADGWDTGAGWYWWFCFPGCLPDSEPIGPFESEHAAIEDAQADADERQDDPTEIEAERDL